MGVCKGGGCIYLIMDLHMGGNKMNNTGFVFNPEIGHVYTLLPRVCCSIRESCVTHSLSRKIHPSVLPVSSRRSISFHCAVYYILFCFTCT